MPFVLAPLVPGLIAWGGRALATYGLARVFSDNSIQELEDMLMGWVVGWIAQKSGLVLDSEDPLSDASLSGAVGARLGFPVRSLKNLDMIREDLDGYAVGLISAKSGYEVRSIQNVATLKEDFLRIGAAELSARLGLPAGVMPGPGAVFDPQQVRVQLLTWAKAELFADMSHGVGVSLDNIRAMADVEGLAAELSGKLAAAGSVQTITARQIAVRISNEMATKAVTDYQRYALNGSKRSRRQELLRAAQAKFRAAHGNRQKYVPLGMSAVIG